MRQYEIERQLASGGMGDLFAATSPEGIPVVIKRMREHLTDEHELREMFKREGALAKTLRHPNIVEVYEVGDWYMGEDEEALPFIAMERLIGHDLREILAHRGRLPVREAARIARSVASALAYAHGRDVVHRDVSPPNIFVTTSGEVKLLDFGIAKTARVATATGLVRGKAGYMAPEQIAGLAVDPRTDVFALGVVLWECLAGRALWERDTETGVARAVRDESAPLLTGVPDALAHLVAQMLAKFPSARPRSAMKVAEALEPFG